ncbi:kinase domain protein (macronuclear) [Tetrahymena thermophila SB210]|uniref:Kinase domain protein n=1 Tax=Tetrahymena thermophila (strain SB210) TaxID=312017 RepID=I7LXY8_TETTS|nr:kinase domain protein [Tetrahymena thermophila SB210]EAS07009.1 kinase domain protein [Tetrahymena thermophila SB210]|eukprot:XP_001027251.1 kinase domain protein [Tetrahymena thermophila SB210]
MQINYINQRYIKQKQIGGGQYGKVFEAKDKQNVFQNIAIKQVNLQYVRPNEKEIWKQIKGQYVVELYDCVQDEQNMYFIMEKCEGGNLQKYIEDSSKQANKQLTQYQILDLFYKIVKGYKESLYENNIIHRDLKPENIMIHEGNPKITDFGMTLKYINPYDMIQFSVAGTPKYAPPEAKSSDKLGNYIFDIYSLGCILYFCLYSNTPQSPTTYNQLNEFHECLKTQGPLAIAFPNRNVNGTVEIVDQPIKDLIQRMIVYQQNQRLTIDEVLNHPAFMRNTFLNNRILITSNLNQIQRLLDNKVKEYIQDKNIAYEKIFTNSSITIQEIRYQELIDKYFQFIFNSTKFTLLVLNQFVQNFTRIETNQESDYIILHFVFYVDITFNYLLDLLDESCTTIPKCLNILENSYLKYKKSNRMKETKQMIIKEHYKWKDLYKQLISELQSNYDKFHLNSQNVYQSFSHKMYYQALYQYSQQQQFNGDYCERILKKIIKEYFRKYPNYMSQEKMELHQGLILILTFLDKSKEINSNFENFSFSSYYDWLQKASYDQEKFKQKIFTDSE